MITARRTAFVAFVALFLGSLFLSTAFAASITVVSPNGGEIWKPGMTKTIRWTSDDVTGNVKIELRRGTERYGELTGPVGTANTGSFSWAIANDIPRGHTYKIAIKNMDNSVRDRSDSFFRIETRWVPAAPPPPTFGDQGGSVSSPRQYDFTVTDIFRDSTSVKARIVASDTFVPAGWVEIQVSGAAPVRHIIRAGTNDIVIGDPPYICLSGGVPYSVTVDPNNRFNESSEHNNTMQKEIWCVEVAGDKNANLNGSIISGDSVRHDCDGGRLRGTLSVKLQNQGYLTLENWKSLVRVVQKGRREIPGTLGHENFEEPISPPKREGPYESALMGVAGRGDGDLEPGEYGHILLNHEKYTLANSTFTFSFSGALSRWTGGSIGTQNPYAVEIICADPETSLDICEQRCGGSWWECLHCSYDKDCGDRDLYVNYHSVVAPGSLHEAYACRYNKNWLDCRKWRVEEYPDSETPYVCRENRCFGRDYDYEETFNDARGERNWYGCRKD